MRKIEQQMVNAVRKRAVRFVNGNTWVSGDGDKSQVFLHNNHIATVHHDTWKVDVNRYTLRKWPTKTTISRLRALGVNVKVKGGAVVMGD